MDKYENELLEETMRPFINSGQAFVCFDSVASLKIVLKHFRPTPLQHVKIFFLGIKDRGQHFFRWITGRDDASQHQLFDSRGRARSNFLQQNDINHFRDINYLDKSHILMMHKASEPLDIIWKNMGVIRTHFVFRRFLFFVLGLIVIVFLSSPTVMLEHIKKIDPTSILNFGWTQDMGKFGTYLQKSGPPLLILLINLGIICLLDAISVIESYDTHSQYQNTVYMKTVIYCNLNMFIIPVLTISSGGISLYQLFMENNFNIAKLLSELFIPKSGEFFILLLV